MGCCRNIIGLVYLLFISFPSHNDFLFLLSNISPGFSITWIVRWFFPLAQPAYFGAIIQVAQATVVTVYLALSTNTWSHDEVSEEDIDGAEERPSSPVRRSGFRIRLKVRFFLSFFFFFFFFFLPKRAYFIARCLSKEVFLQELWEQL
jgi:hypothetical protein